MAQSDNLLFMQNPELATALRRRRMGEALMQGGTDTSPVQHWTQGAARLAQALVGGYEQAQADKGIKEAGDKRQALLAKLMADDDMPAMGGQSAPQPQPMTAPPPGPVSQMPMAPPDLAPFIEEQARARGIPPALATSLFATESNFNPMARNPRSGAFGIGQVLASTAAQPGYGLPPISEADLADPRKAIPWSLDYLKARGGALGVQDFNDPQQAARALRAYGENTDEYERKVLGGAGMMPQGQGVQVAGPGAPSAPQQPQQGPQDFLAMAQRLQQRAQAAAAAGETGLAQQFQNQAVTYRQLAMQKPPSEDVVVVPNGDGSYRYVPKSRAGGMPAPEPRPMVSIQNTGESAYERQRAETLGGRVKEWEDANVKSAQTLNRLTQMERALDQFTTGAGAGAILKAGQIAQRLNVPAATLEALGINPEQVASGEAIRSLASQMLVGMIGSGGFPAQGFSNADREMLERALPGLANSPGGNKMIINIMRAGAQRDIEIGRAWRDWSRRNGDSLQSVRGFQAEILPGIVERNIVAPILEQGGWQEVPASGPGGFKEGDVAVNPQTKERLIFRNGQWGPAQ